MSLNKYYNGNIFCSNNYLNSISKKMMMYEDELEKKDELIGKLKQNLNEEKNKCHYYEIKFGDIKRQYIKFQEGKDKLNSAINLLKENLINYEKQIKELEEINLVKDEEIMNLKSQALELEAINAEKGTQISQLTAEINEYENNIVSLNEEIRGLQGQIENLTSELDIANAKLNTPIISRIFSSK